MPNISSNGSGLLVVQPGVDATSDTDSTTVNNRAIVGNQPDFSTPTGGQVVGGIASITGTANEITVTGASNVVLSLPVALTFTGKTVTGGTYAGGAFNGTLGATTPAAALVTTLGASGTATLVDANFSGLLTATQSLNGVVAHKFRNTSNGANAFCEIEIGNDTSASQAYIGVIGSGVGAVYGGAGSVYMGTAANKPVTIISNNAVVGSFTSTGLAVTGAFTTSTGFGCNSKTAQTAFASGGALAAYGAGINGFDTGANASALHAMVVSIRAALVANGIMS